MVLNEEFKDFVMEQLCGIDGLTFRKMFGGGGIFHDGKMFGLLHESALFLKVDDTNREMFETNGMKQFTPFPDKPMKMPYYGVPAEVLESKESLKEWSRASMEIAHK